MFTEPTVRTAPSAGADSSKVHWHMTGTSPGAATLKIQGNLKPGWLGRLSSYLSHHTVSLTGGYARKSSSLSWDATFAIEAGSSNGTPLNVLDPLPAIMAVDTRAAIPVITIADFQVEHSTRHGGSLYTETSGKDCIGFLYGLLRMFSFYSLFPAEVDISTKGMVAHDRFWLKGIGSATPSPDDLKALYERLQQTYEGGLRAAGARSSVIDAGISRYRH